MVLFSDPLLQFEDQLTLNKYKTAGKICSKILDRIIKLVKPGILVHDICEKADNMIIVEVAKVYNNIKHKGIAFPTCISINNMAGFFAPNKNDNTIINQNDIVKIELGVHIDGFPALICYTVVINVESTPINHYATNAMQAVAKASKDILKIMKPGNTNLEVVNIMEKYAKKYNCNLPFISEDIIAPGVMSYQISKNVIDGFNDDDDDI